MVKRYIWILLGMTLLLVGCSEKKIEANVSNQKVDAFEFENQDKELVSSEDLIGDWWVASFMYTDCQTVCPRTTEHLKKIQDTFKEKSPKLISFTVNPEYDNVERLKTYADEHDVDTNSWSFLTGYEFETIKKLSNQSFKAVLTEGAAEQRAHSYYFYLINPKGEVIKKYDGLSSEDTDRLILDLKKLK